MFVRPVHRSSARGAPFAWALAAALSLAACERSAESPPGSAAAERLATAAATAKADRRGPPASDGGIAWRPAAHDAEVDALFAEAKQAGKPVFVYWGASWCPPCNQVKATLFNRQDFIERSRAFVPVYIDGDVPGAQKLGARFRVSGYPTMVLFNPQGEEVTRLPGEVEASRYNEVLDLGMNAARPVKTLVRQALAGDATLTANDWRLLAYYSWETDQQQAIGDGADMAQTLARVAAACPPELGAVATRLHLKGLVVADEKAPPALAPAVREQLLAALADPARAREQADLVLNYADDIAKALAPEPGPARAAAVAALGPALVRLQDDTSLSRADRVQAVISRVNLARLDEPKRDAKAGPASAPRLPEPLLAEVRRVAASADREITDGYERQAVISSAAWLLDRAGLGGESDALLEANLAKSHAPYYLMSGLAGNARRRGDAPRAIEWSRKAWEASEGPATRLQWGASYLATLVDLAPADEQGVEAAAVAVWREAMAQPDALHQRSLSSLRRIGRKVAAWSRAGQGAHAAAAVRIQQSLRGLCDGAEAGGRLDPAACRALVDAKPTPAAEPAA